MELTPAQREALTAALHDVRGEVSDRVAEYAAAVWRNLGDWRDDDIARFVAEVAPRVEAGKLTVAQATDAYIAAMIDAEPVGVVDLSQSRGGVPASTVYRRPAVDMRSALANGASFQDALEKGAKRLDDLVRTDLQLAHTHQARASMTGGAILPGSKRRRARRPRGAVEAFRRVPSGSENCALCLIASTQRYWVGDLMPIHPGCDCGVAPLGVGEHLSQVIDPELLEATHDQVELFAGMSDRGGRDVDYRRLIVASNHGEYGPTLRWKHQKFTGPDALAAHAEAEAVEDAAARLAPAAASPVEAQASTYLFDAIKGDDLGEWDQYDLRELLTEAATLNDMNAYNLVSAELGRREEQAAGFRGTGFTSAELRRQWDEHIEVQYWQAEARMNSMVNAEGLAAGVTGRSLFKGTQARAYKYATDELKWFWTENPRLTFDAFAGDADAIANAGKAEF